MRGMSRLPPLAFCFLLLLTKTGTLEANTNNEMTKGVSEGLTLKNGSFEAIENSRLSDSGLDRDNRDLLESLEVEAQKNKAQGEVHKNERQTPSSIPVLCWPPNLPPVMPTSLKSNENSSIKKITTAPKSQEKKSKNSHVNKDITSHNYSTYSNYYNYLHNPYYWDPYMNRYWYNQWTYIPENLWGDNHLYWLMNPYMWYWTNLQEYGHIPLIDQGGFLWGGGTYDWYWSQNWMFWDHGYRNGGWYGWRMYSGRFWNGRYFDYFQGWRFWDWRLYRNNGTRGNWRYWGWRY